MCMEMPASVQPVTRLYAFVDPIRDWTCQESKHVHVADVLYFIKLSKRAIAWSVGAEQPDRTLVHRSLFPPAHGKEALRKDGIS